MKVFQGTETVSVKNSILLSKKPIVNISFLKKDSLNSYKIIKYP